MRDRVDRPIELPTDELRALRPQADRLRMESARERAERALFGSATPAKLGRYVLLGQAIDGGMGVVYAAYDPDLYRKVALKVLRPGREADMRAKARTVLEARALAKLDHPNVVKVHDVITQDDQVVIVMEWIDGKTLTAWEHERARSWREIVPVYAQAAQGLAAVHGVDVIHRDFKPANAIIGADGRVRVVDFGLARTVSSDEAQAAQSLTAATSAGPEQASATDLTATGDMVGTLAYAAPEQISGATVTPASDQFSFGVALHRALEGVPPFVGADASSIARNIRDGRMTYASEPRALPAWLRAIVARALSADPADRFPSMTGLLAELMRPRGWRRWRIPLAVTLCMSVAVVAIVMRPSAADPAAACDGGHVDMAGVWSTAQHIRVRSMLTAIATPYALGIRDRVVHDLDNYRDRWTALHREACVSYHHGTQSAALLDRRMLCMQQHLGDLRATVGVLAQLDASSATNAQDVIARMPDLAQCADVERLEAETPPPSGSVQRALVDAARARTSQAMALDRAGHSAEAVFAGSTAIAQAEQSAYPPVVAEAALAQGRILLARWDNQGAVAAFRRARTIALAQHQLALAVEAAARMLYAEGAQNADVRAAERDAAVFLPMSESLSGDRFARPLLLNNLGTVYMAAEDRAQATRYFQQAHDALAGVASPELELTIIDRNLALVTPDARQREALAQGVWQRLRAETGDAHLATLEALISYARYIAEPSRALPLLTRACQILDDLHPELVEQRVYCESYRAFLLGEVGDTAAQLHSYEVVVRDSAGSTSDEVSSRVALARGYIELLRGDLSGAVAQLAPTARLDVDSTHWWAQAQAADVALALGTARHQLGQHTAAARDLMTAREIYQRVISVNEEAEFRLKLALAERALDAVRRMSQGGAGHAEGEPPRSGGSGTPSKNPEHSLLGGH